MRKPQRAAASKRNLGNDRVKRVRAAKVPAAEAKRAAPRPRKKRRRAPSPAYHPGPQIDGEATLRSGVEALLAQDPAAIGLMLQIGGPPPLRLQAPGFAGLVRIIVAQQVSVASAAAIMRRVAAGIVPLEPAAMLAASDADLRACGLSSPKMRALRALAAARAGRTLELDALAAMAPEDAHRALVAVKGIGPWTADVFLLFCLGHPDAWPAGDIALQEAARLMLKLKKRPDARALERIGERWRPWRGVAARMLWACYRAAKAREGIVTEAS